MTSLTPCARSQTIHNRLRVLVGLLCQARPGLWRMVSCECLINWSCSYSSKNLFHFPNSPTAFCSQSFYRLHLDGLSECTKCIASFLSPARLTLLLMKGRSTRSSVTCRYPKWFIMALTLADFTILLSMLWHHWRSNRLCRLRNGQRATERHLFTFRVQQNQLNQASLYVCRIGRLNPHEWACR